MYFLSFSHEIWHERTFAPPPKGIAGVDICPLFMFTKVSLKNLYVGQSSHYKTSLFLMVTDRGLIMSLDLQNLLEETLSNGT